MIRFHFQLKGREKYVNLSSSSKAEVRTDQGALCAFCFLRKSCKLFAMCRFLLFIWVAYEGFGRCRHWPLYPYIDVLEHKWWALSDYEASSSPQKENEVGVGVEMCCCCFQVIFVLIVLVVQQKSWHSSKNPLFSARSGSFDRAQS